MKRVLNILLFCGIFAAANQGFAQSVAQPGDPVIASSANSPGSEGVANAIDGKPTKYLNFDSTKSIQSFNIKNYGGGKLKWEIEPSLPWVVVSPDGGSLRTGTTVSLKLD